MPPVVHMPRLAWEAARALVVAAGSDAAFPLVAQRIATSLPEYWPAYVNTRNRILRPDRDDVVNLEIGVWRVRMEELLRQYPQMANALPELTAHAAASVGPLAGAA
jgi:hypothetical protein